MAVVTSKRGVTPERVAGREGPRHRFPEFGPIFGVSVGYRGGDQSRVVPTPIHPVFVIVLFLLLRNAPHRSDIAPAIGRDGDDTLYMYIYIYIYMYIYA